MDIKDCYRTIKNDFSFRHLFWGNYQKARQSFDSIIAVMREERPGVKIVLHHLELGCNNYEEWSPVVPMYYDEHLHLHLHSLITKGHGKYGVLSDDPAYARIRYNDILNSMSPEEKKLFKNKDSARSRNYRLQNGDKIKERAREKNQENSERNKTRCKMYRAKRKALETDVERQERLAKRREKEKAREGRETVEQRQERLKREAAYAQKRRNAKGIISA
jgi:hypothetical protein